MSEALSAMDEDVERHSKRDEITAIVRQAFGRAWPGPFMTCPSWSATCLRAAPARSNGRRQMFQGRPPCGSHLSRTNHPDLTATSPAFQKRWGMVASKARESPGPKT